MATLLGHGVYSIPEASSLTRLKRPRIREWFRGHKPQFKQVFQSDYEPVRGDFAISFLDLIDVFVAGQLREHGVSLQTLRRVYRRMEQDLNTKHPFARRELLSDGNEVFMHGLDNEGKAELVQVLTRQKVFPEILLPFLKRIDYGGLTNLAQRWRIAEMVVIDPKICFGKPIIEEAGIPTAILAAVYLGNNRDADLVADWYNVQPAQVVAAAQFESSLAA